MADAPLAIAQSTNDAEPPSRASPGLEVAGQYSDTTSGLSFLHRAWRRISNKEGAQLVNGQLGIAEDSQLLMSAGDKPFRQIGQMRMPSSEHSHALLDLYFDVCIATYRLLHRQTVEAWLTCVLENAESNVALSNGTSVCKRRNRQPTLLICSSSRHRSCQNSSGAFSACNRILSRRKGQRRHRIITRKRLDCRATERTLLCRGYPLNCERNGYSPTRVSSMSAYSGFVSPHVLPIQSSVVRFWSCSPNHTGLGFASKRRS